MSPGSAPNYLWLDGEIVKFEAASVHVTELAITGSTVAFDGIRAYSDPERRELFLFRPEEHMQRLARSMKLLSMETRFSTADLAEATAELLRRNETRDDTYIRPMAYVGGSKLFADPVRTNATVVIDCLPIGSNLSAPARLECCVASWRRISDNVMPPRIKCSSNYANARFVQREARLNGYDDGIILDERGKVTEATVSSIIMIRDGVAVTPPVTSSILEGITRLTLIELLRNSLKVPVVEREVDRTELYIADEVFACGTGREIAAITSVDRFPVGTGEIGPVTQQLAKCYRDIVRGIDPKYVGWRSPVWDRVPEKI